MIVPAPSDAMMLALTKDPHATKPDRQTPGLKTRGPERPPKSLTLNA